MVDRNVAERLSSNSAFALELEGVGRQFGALVALADINLRVQAGERRAILGSNGAGKTTLFNAVTGDFPPTTGRIRFFSEDVTAFPCLRADPPGSAPHLSDQSVVRGPYRHRQHLCRLPGRVPRPPVAPAAGRARRHDGAGACDRAAASISTTFWKRRSRR